ncbi:MAG: c-type cytochrome [Phycisphaerales bacterium]|nr:c-type cytochrome [Phycisphaerales bacterium]
MKHSMFIALVFSFVAGPAALADDAARWEAENPVKPLPKPPLGIDSSFDELKVPPTPERVRLGRWLFFDKRLSADGSVSCATCHRPEYAFSEPTPVSEGIKGQKGTRKAPSFLNQAWTIYPNFFWDGRAGSLEEQALGPIENPIEMGNTHHAMISTLQGLTGYHKYFDEAFGTPEVTKERVAQAIADYERTRMSGNSAYDKWQEARFADDYKPTDETKLIEKGFELFNGKAQCNQCHLGQNFTDSLFHNLGIGWNAEKNELADIGRFKISNKEEDKGAFKTPGLRDVSKHAPYMHDGSVKTLRETVEHYNKGGNANPWLSPKIKKLELTDDEIDAIVAFMKSLDGEGYMDRAPEHYPE